MASIEQILPNMISGWRSTSSVSTCQKPQKSAGRQHAIVSKCKLWQKWSVSLAHDFVRYTLEMFHTENMQYVTVDEPLAFLL